MNKASATMSVMAAALILVCSVAEPLLAANSQSADTDIWTAAGTGDIEAIKKNLAAGVNVNASFVQPGVPGSGGTPLHIAVVYGQLGSAKLLLSKGADIEAKAADEYKGAPLSWAAFAGRMDAVKFLIEAGANVNARDQKGSTVLDAAGLNIIPSDDRAAIVSLLRSKGGKSGQEQSGTGATAYRGSYFMNGEIHVGYYGAPEGKPLTSGHQDFKPSWSKTGDMLVFFRRLVNDPITVNWKTAICIINVDGTGFHQLTDGTHTDFNQTWTRDGTNTPIWNRKNPFRGRFYVMQSKVGASPGEEVALTDKRYHSWAYTCLKDGRILVQSTQPKQGHGYYLMTRSPGGNPSFQRIDCELATKGILDRISVSPSETRVCFEYQTGFKYKDTGRTLYIADFDAAKPSITNAKPFANEQKDSNPWFAYPRWTPDEAAIVYHASGKLYLYTLKDASTRKVSTNDSADYRYPHTEATPK